MARGSPTDWDRLRRRVYRRDDWQCQCCGRRGNTGGDAQLHAHHIVERSDGGPDELDNLITLCDRCHAAYHDNPHLLEDGPPDEPSVRSRLTDWLLIDVLSVRTEDARTSSRETPQKSERRQHWRRVGLIALEELAEERSKPDGIVTKLFGNTDDSPPRLYSVAQGGLLTRTSDEAVNEQFQGCPGCGRSELTADWISWERRGSAKRVQCTACDTLFDEQVVDRNGRSLVALEPVPSVFELETVSSPVWYQQRRPTLSLVVFGARYGTSCPECGGTHTLHYGWGWDGERSLPGRRWRCNECDAEFRENEEQYQPV